MPFSDTLEDCFARFGEDEELLLWLLIGITDGREEELDSTDDWELLELPEEIFLFI